MADAPQQPCHRRTVGEVHPRVAHREHQRLSMLGRDDAVNTAQTGEAGLPGEGTANDQRRRRTEVADVVLDSKDVGERSFTVVSCGPVTRLADRPLKY